MLRAMIAALLLFIAVTAQAQKPQPRAVGIKGDLSKYIFSQKNGAPRKNGARPNDAGDEFIAPEDSLLSLRRQVELQMFPADFYPAVEPETDPAKRQAIRYGIAYYRDSQAPGISGSVDLMFPLRFDTRSGALSISYFHVYFVINTSKVEYQEGRPALAVLPTAEGSAMLFVAQQGKQELVTFEGLFTENPHFVNLLSGSDIDGIKTDDIVGEFAVFVRGGSDRASLFVLNSDTSLDNVQTYEVISNLPASDRAYIFEIIPAQNPTYVGAPVK